MAANRFTQIRTEDEAHEVLLDQLAKAHTAESRAAEVVAEECLRGRYRYAGALGWLEWDGARWDTDLEVEDKVVNEVRLFIDAKERDYRARVAAADTRLKAVVKAVMDRLGEEGATLRMLKKEHEIVDEHGTAEEAIEYNAAFREVQTSKQQADMWLNLLSAAKIRSICGLGRGMDGIRTRTTEFDADLDLLNCANGVVDLRTGELHPHNPEQLNTKVAGAAYVPTARNEWFDKALEAAHPEARDWFQVRAGQALTGHTPEDDSLVLCAGGGENGKTSVMTGLLRAAGDYGDVINSRVLMVQPGQHPTELMDLRGLRIALLEETPEEGHLDTHQLKTTIGTPKIKARHMRKDSVTFLASHSLFINTNYTPQVDSTDHGTWRRLKAMPWPYRFVTKGAIDAEENERRGDPAIKHAMLHGDGVPEAVLAWMVAGARAWYSNDRRMFDDPQVVIDSIGGWRAKTDVGYQFALDCLAPCAESFIPANVLRAEFDAYLLGQNKKAWSAQLMNTRMPESLRAAGIRVDADPTKPAKVRKGDKQSKPAPAVPVNGDPWHQPTRPGYVDISEGKALRMWRGVRFKTEAEMNGQHLKAV